jgi:hypothetical protein
MTGPVIYEDQEQDARSCVSALVKRRLEASKLDYVFAGYFQPQLRYEVGEPLSSRILSLITVGNAGNVRDDAEGKPFPDGARLLLLDRATRQQAAFQAADISAIPKDKIAILDSYQECRFRP